MSFANFSQTIKLSYEDSHKTKVVYEFETTDLFETVAHMENFLKSIGFSGSFENAVLDVVPLPVPDDKNQVLLNEEDSVQESLDKSFWKNL